MTSNLLESPDLLVTVDLKLVINNKSHNTVNLLNSDKSNEHCEIKSDF